MDADIAAEVRALRAGRARFDLSGWTRVRVRGADATRFLDDLVTGPVAGLRPSDATRSLLLSPTGRVRADFTVARLDEGYLLVQSPDQPRRVDDLLTPYVLSAAVAISDACADGSLVALVSDAEAGGEGYRPGALGAGSDARSPAPEALTGLASVTAQAVESWRILEGRPRFGSDFGADALPAEAGLETAIDWTKGCFLGQEAVAKVRNLGHPPFVVIAFRADRVIESGEPVRAENLDDDAGAVTSCAEDPDGGFGGLARVRWAARDAALRTGTGIELDRTA